MLELEAALLKHINTSTALFFYMIFVVIMERINYVSARL